MDAVIYTSNTGFTAQYAKLFAARAVLPVYSLAEARAKLRPGAPVVYMGWLMGGMVRGYKKAANTFDVRAVCGVGMGKTGSQIEEVRKANRLDASMPIFTLQGGFDRQKLKGIYRIMMNMAVSAKAKAVAGRGEQTPEEADMLDLVTRGGNRVSEENLAELEAWFDAAK